MSFLLSLACAIPSLGLQTSTAQERHPDLILNANEVGSCHHWGSKFEVKDGSVFGWGFCEFIGPSYLPVIKELNRNSNGWNTLPNLFSPRPFIGDNFGQLAFSVHGSLMVVTSTSFPDQFAPKGRSYVFEKSGANWVLVAELRQAVSESTDGYGIAAALAADTILVTAPNKSAVLSDGSTGYPGAVYIYNQMGGSWVQSQIWTPPLTPEYEFSRLGDQLGAGDGVFAVGNYKNNELHIVEQVSGGGWQTTAVLSQFAWIYDHLGWSISVGENLIAVGTDYVNPIVPGEVIVVERVNGTWATTQVIQSPDTQPIGNRFGHSVDVHGDLMVIGDPDAGPLPGWIDLPGAAYLYRRAASGQWRFESKLVRSDPWLSGDAGWSVGIWDEFVVVGDRGANNGAGSINGALMLFELPIGESVCDSAINSTGHSARLELQGSKHAGIGYLRATVLDLPVQSSGMLLASTSTGFIPHPGLSNGNLCLTGSILRFSNPEMIFFADSDGMSSVQIDLDGSPLAPNSTVQAGQTWAFQCWYRDQWLQFESNFSQSVKVTFE